MEGFITFLFFFVLFMWAMGKLFPIVLAWVIKRKMKNMQNMQQNAAYGNYGDEQRKQEGKVIISDIPKQDKVIDKEVGEYVDFEE